MDDLLKQFLPSGVSLDQHWLKITMAIVAGVSAWLINRGMPADQAKELTYAIAGISISAIIGISHVQAARLKGAASVAASQTPAQQTNINSDVSNVAPPKPVIPTPSPAPAAVPEQPAPQPPVQVIQLTVAQLKTLLSTAGANALAQHKAAQAANADTIADGAPLPKP